LTAKERHKNTLLGFLGNPENDYPPRVEYARILSVSTKTLYQHFSPADLQDIENEAYEIRKKNSTRQRSIVLGALYQEAQTGNVSAAKEFLDRTEGKVTEKHEHGGDMTATIRWQD
jgi:hypothetical protein